MNTPNNHQSWHRELWRYKFVLYFLLSQVILLFGLITFVSVYEEDLPAPRISSSTSFNEKARWLRNLGSKKCDVLVIGSSMALNNIDWDFIQPMLKNKSVVNTASWGLSISDSAAFVEYFAPLCKPDLIVLTEFFGDFHYEQQQPQHINWKLFEEYVKGTPAWIIYLKTIDLGYYGRTLIGLKQLSYFKKNTIYASLRFDKTGSVMFDCDNFEVDKKRWDGWNNDLAALNNESFQKEVDSLFFIEKFVKNHQIHLVVISTPLRKMAEEKVTTTWVKPVLENAEQSIVDSGGIFIKVSSLSDFPDSFFTDFAHLNMCGARKVAQLIAPTIILTLTSKTLNGSGDVKYSTDPAINIESPAP